MLPFVSTPVMRRRLPSSIRLARRSSTPARTASRPCWFTIRRRASTSPCSWIELPRARDFALDVQGVADLHRLLEDGVAHPAQRDDALGVERQQPDGEREHEQAVRDLLAEAAAGGPLGVGVLRMRVAREGGELEDVAPR